jgi:hypothetical protein
MLLIFFKKQRKPLAETCFIDIFMFAKDSFQQKEDELWNKPRNGPPRGPSFLLG